MKSEVVSKLQGIVGEDQVVSDVLDCIAYGGEAVPFDIEEQNIPIAVVKPKSSQEISQILKYANEVKVPVAIHGSGTSFIFTSRPKREGSIVLSTSRLDSMELHEEDRYVEVGAGVVTFVLEQFLLRHGYILPISTGSKLVSTIGGAFAVNTIGHMIDACAGKPADHALGLEVVLPAGGQNQGGKVYSKGTEYCKGDPQQPMTYEEVIGKFLSQTEGGVSRDKADKIIDLVENLEQLSDICEITRLTH